MVPTSSTSARGATWRPTSATSSALECFVPRILISFIPHIHYNALF
ncbi:hypothetical protein AG1IA_04189 [Rhizoctonia solani AG-1 IA]|uniref:Uncharacterized protein n=1 Tax=Thanatephorus cucumeris (strain AG1-IA) TaxID=983506 RepID=L8WZL3_THACA|nr:hypothetical protein AG1IA_04189 [Rhizoctonia solani AG-1 IA]